MKKLMAAVAVCLALLPLGARAEDLMDSFPWGKWRGSTSDRAWAPPTQGEWLQLGLVETLIAVDVSTTIYALHLNDSHKHTFGVSEGNVFNGAHPTDLRMLAAGGIGLGVTAGAWYVLPPKIRWVVPLFVGIGVLAAVGQTTYSIITF